MTGLSLMLPLLMFSIKAFMAPVKLNTFTSCSIGFVTLEENSRVTLRFVRREGRTWGRVRYLRLDLSAAVFQTRRWNTRKQAAVVRCEKRGGQGGNLGLN